MTESEPMLTPFRGGSERPCDDQLTTCQQAEIEHTADQAIHQRPIVTNIGRLGIEALSYTLDTAQISAVVKRTNTFAVRPLFDADERLLRRLLDASASLWNELTYERRQTTSRASRCGDRRL